MSNRFFPVPNDAEYKNCGSNSQVPVNVSYLSPTPGEVVNPAKIGFKWHPASQHVAIENYQPPSYYENYIMTNSYSASMQKLQQTQMDRLISLHERTSGPQSFIEIGCGDGSFMKYARGRVPRIVGVEPSAIFAQEAIREGFEVVIGYVGSERLITEEKFDAFASRQVFEHLPDPRDVLTGIRNVLNEGAVGLVEVPNGQRSLRTNRFYDFFPDHVNYYSVNSLVALASDTGFNVISCNESFGGDYLELWLRYTPSVERWFGDMLQQRDNVCAALMAKIRESAISGRKVAIWGCGAKTLTILAATNESDLAQIAFIIDSDPHKHGRFVPNSSIPIVSPAQATKEQPETIFVLALSYRKEITEDIRRTIPGCRKIYTISDAGAIEEL